MTTTGPPLAARIARLRQNPLCAELNESAATILAQSATLRHIAQGDYLFLRGEASGVLYLLLVGIVDIVLASADGRELVINELHAGECLGELGVLTHQPRSASAVARSDCDVLAVPGAVLWEAMGADPGLTRRLLVMTASRLRASSEREGVLAFMDAEARVARLLLYLDKLNERTGYITISQAELGDWAGLTRQTVATILGRWRRRGWLATGRGRIVVFDYVRLGKVGQQF